MALVTKEKPAIEEHIAMSASAPGYHIMTWGCQMNEEDSEQMSLYLEQMGYRHVSDAAQAEVVLLNTCSVRAKPEDKVWSELGRLREIKQTRAEMIIGAVRLHGSEWRV